MATTLAEPRRTRDPFAGIPLPYHDRVRLRAHYADAEPHVEPDVLRTWRRESVIQLATNAEAAARELARTGRIHAAARWQRTADAAFAVLGEMAGRASWLDVAGRVPALAGR
ncbi:MAG TPA: hypothetical protein VF192_12210 [Longimicrobiales bacterium]